MTVELTRQELEPDYVVQESEQFHQERMEQLLRQAGLNQDYTPPAARKEPQGYVRTSLSAFELQDKLASLPDFNIRNPDYTALIPSRSSVLGSLRGIEGHTMDNVVCTLLRAHLAQLRHNYTSNQTLFPTPEEFLSAFPVLKPYEQSYWEGIIREFSCRYRTIRMADIPFLSADIIAQWREGLVFHSLASPRSAHSNLVEGTVYTSEEIEEIWKQQEGLATVLASAYQLAIDDFLRGDIFSSVLPIIEALSKEITVEDSIRLNIQLPHGVKLQTAFRTDYVCFGNNQNAYIIDAKFGRWEQNESPTQRLQRFLYCAGVSAYIKQKGPNISLSSNVLNGSDVLMMYKIFDLTSPRPSISYDSKAFSEEETDELRREFEIRATHLWFMENELKRISKVVSQMYSIPRIPKPGESRQHITQRMTF